MFHIFNVCKPDRAKDIINIRRHNNLYGHPHKELLARLEVSKLLITQIDGSVKIK